MKGLELSEKYYWEVGLPVLERECGDKLMRMAIGLAGEGSECFGFDDELSRESDWGPGFAIWLSAQDFKSFGSDLARIYDSLPQNYMGYSTRETVHCSTGRVGVLEINRFLKTILGTPHLPRSPLEWLTIPEEALATAVNGKIFQDPQGTLMAIRKTLLRYYPEEVRLKKIAERLTTAGLTGQYNYQRCVKRNDPCAAHLAEAKFIEAALSAVFLLNRSYMPFYKWAHRAVRQLDILGEYTYDTILQLVQSHDPQKKEKQIAHFCHNLITQLHEQGLTDGSSNLLIDHGALIRARITDEAIRDYQPTAG